MVLARSLLNRFRMLLSGVVVFAVVATFFTTVSPVQAAETVNTPVVGSFGVGGDLSGGVDERTGVFDVHVPVLSLPGVGGAGGVDVGLSYAQELAAGSVDRYGVGAGWSWSGSFVDVDGGVRVFPASGGVFNADASKPSGLDRYTLGDLLFLQESGYLPPRDGVGVVEYSYSLVYAGGITDYFNQLGDLVARTDVFGYRTDWVWESEVSHRLIGVVDGAGSRAQVLWTEVGMEIITPTRSDGMRAKTVLEVSGSRLGSVTDPLGERVIFGYHDDGLIDVVRSGSGAITTVSYQVLPDKSTAVDRVVVVVDSVTGTEFSVREWDIVGDRTASGWPTYSDQGALWVSGDGEFRYRTRLFDGATRVVSEYNSLGLMVGREMVVSAGLGDVVVQEQRFEFPGTQGGGVPDPQVLPMQYAKPLTTTVVFHDGRGGAREVSEQTVFDESGRLTKQVSADGSVTETVYDTQIPSGMVLPIGVVVEQTTTGADGVVSRTVNTPTADRKAIAVTETLVGHSVETLVSTSRTEMVVEREGFVSEERVIATGVSAAGLDTVVKCFARTFDDNAGTITVSETNAAGTPAQTTVSTVIDTTTGLPVSTTDPIGRVSQTRYDIAARVVGETDPTGLETVTEYGNKVTRVTKPSGVTRSEYVDVLGNLIKVTDNLMVNADGAVAPVRGFERTVETRAYEQNTSKITVTDARGLETVTVTDVFGRVIEVITANGLRQVTEYDDVANTARSGLIVGSGELSAAPLISTTLKDDVDRVVKESSTRADYEHDSDRTGKVGVPESATRESTTRYDGLGRITEQVSDDVSTSIVLNPDGTPKITTLSPTRPQEFAGKPVTAEREHNLLGVSTKKTLTQTDGENRPGVSRVLDAAGRVVSETDQAGKTSIFEYTVDGLVARVHNEATGVVTRNTYDPVTRAVVATETIAPNGAVSQTGFEYDRVTGEMLAVFDPSDRAGTQVQYKYDVFGNVTQILYPDGKTIRHAFDEHGRQTTSTDIVGNITRYEYDRLGFLVGVTQTSPQSTVLGDVKYIYDTFGRIVKLSRGNNVTTEYTFTSADQIRTETTTHGDTIIRDAEYVYDDHGNLTTSTDIRQDETAQEHHATDGLVVETRLYTYDAYNRLTASSVYDGAEAAGQPRLHTDYELNVSGDVTQETTIAHTSGTAIPPTTTVASMPGVRINDSVTDEATVKGSGTVTVRKFEYNLLGHLTAVTTDGVRAEQQYDAAGNLTHSFEGTDYSYNLFNQPVTETRPDGSTVQSTYWATGQRHTTTAVSDLAGVDNPVTETIGLYWDETILLNDTYTTEESDSTVAGSYLIGASRHTRTMIPLSDTGSIANTDYYITDRHGNTTALTTNTGEIVTAYTYTDYGQTATSIQVPRDARNGNPFQYAGEYTTPTGTQYLAARTYDPATMRFTTQDVAELHNLYAYANSNPITMVDPTGQTPDWDSLTNGIFAAVGVVMAMIGFALTLPTGGASWNLIATGIAVAGLVADVGVVVTQVVDEYVDDFMTDKQSEILTWTSMAIGMTSLVTGFFASTKMVAKSASKTIPALKAARTAKKQEARLLKNQRRQKNQEDHLRENQKRNTTFIEHVLGPPEVRQGQVRSLEAAQVKKQVAVKERQDHLPGFILRVLLTAGGTGGIIAGGFVIDKARDSSTGGKTGEHDLTNVVTVTTFGLNTDALDSSGTNFEVRSSNF